MTTSVSSIGVLYVSSNISVTYMCFVKCVCFVFQDKPSRSLMKLLLDRFDVQVAVNAIQGELYARLSITPYVVFDDVIKLGDAVEVLHKESI